MQAELTRRDVIRLGVGGSLALALGRLMPVVPGTAAADTALAAAPPTYGDWRDIYRDRWKWDRVVHGSHTNTNCVSSCAWRLYARDGIVWREEQTSEYAASNETVPDFNPRGCQKGACASDLMIGPSRIRYPMRRTGPRGSGQWKRISWDEALDEVANALIDELSERGGKGAILELGPNVDFGPNTAGVIRFFRLLGIPVTDSMAMIGDVPVGGTITLGTAHTGGSSDDWFRSKYLVLWAFNPTVTRIPDAHFVTETRYGGGRVVVVAPDYNQTAIHSDLWLSVKPGTDAALALAACQVILEEGLSDDDYIGEQTDLPFLVRTDNDRFLRESDMVEGGSESRFALRDEENGALVWAPGTAGSDDRTLELDGVRPALDTSATLKLLSGEQVEVETVLRRLRRKLDAEYRPEQVAGITGLAPDLIRRFARDFAGAPAALIVSNYGACKNLHSDLIQRSQILLASLTGNLGKAGGGWRTNVFVPLEGWALLTMQPQLDIANLAWLFVRSKLWPEETMHAVEAGYVSSTLFHAVHGGLVDISGAPEHGDPALPEGAAPYLKEAIDKGHFPIGPGPDEPPPSVIVSAFGNVLRHARSYPTLRERLFDPARLIVDVNFRTSETGQYADLILPAAGWYEKVGIKYNVMLVPYVTLADQAVDPAGEAKPEWEIFSLLANRVAARATERDVGLVKSWRGDEIDLREFDATFSDDGRFGPEDQEAALDWILGVSTPTGGAGLEELREVGAFRFKALGTQGGMMGVYSEYDENAPVVPFRDFVEKKVPYPTLTGRQQFYVDHPWFLELGEGLPAHKAPPRAGGDYPLVMTAGHARWSIHAQWRDERLLLRLQRGEPVVYLNLGDCERRGIGDHDRVRVRNDLGSFVARAKPTDSIRPGQVHIFHAWEPYQFQGRVSHQAICPSPLKVTQLVGDYGHIKWGYGHYEPNQVDRDTRVEVEKLA